MVRALLCQSVLKGTQHSGEQECCGHPQGSPPSGGPGQRHTAGAMSTTTTSLKGTGNLGVLPRVLSSLKLPFQVCWGPWQMATHY